MGSAQRTRPCKHLQGILAEKNAIPVDRRGIHPFSILKEEISKYEGFMKIDFRLANGRFLVVECNAAYGGEIILHSTHMHVIVPNSTV